MKRWICMALAGAGVMCGQGVLTRRDAVAEALGQHPELAVARARTGVAEGLRTQAGFGLNPRLILQHENVRGYGGQPMGYWGLTDTFVLLQQTIETAGRRGLRVEAASGAVELAGLGRELARRRIAALVSAAYWTAAGAAAREALYEETVASFQQMVDYHENRVREGAMAEIDLLRVRLEQNRVRITRNQAHLEAERARVELLRAMGRTSFPAVALSDSIRGGGSPVPLADPDEALRQRIEVQAARSAVAHARSLERLQLAQARPNVDTLFGYKRTNGFHTAMGGIQVDLPFRNRNEGNIAAASAEVRVAESGLAATEAIVRAEVEAARVEWEIRRDEAVRLLAPLVEGAREVHRIAEAAYREGGTDLLRLLDARRARVEAEIAHSEGLTRLRLSETAVETAMGVAP